MRQDSPRRIQATASCASCRRPSRGGGCFDRRRVMADVAYVLLVIGGFAVLALTLRGLQRL
jgi:hypothetical protein